VVAQQAGACGRTKSATGDHNLSDKTVSPTDVRARLAATAVILRDGQCGIEAFMVVRHQASDFASGALVFPGGKVDAADADAAWADLVPEGLAPAGRALHVAAAREAFEEAGVMLARRHGSPGLISAAQAHALVARYRPALIGGGATFIGMMRQEGLTLASELMIPYAHWITPEGLPKRFDTHFFLVAAPVEQLGAHDGSEAVEGLWIRPAQALADAAARRRTLVFATQLNLQRLTRFATVAEAVAATRAAPVVTVMPRVVNRTATSRTLQIPAEAGYGVSEVVIGTHIAEANRD
jgi:8-oxo-dGTP pyrophosphatase MutT (NUDIX family)